MYDFTIEYTDERELKERELKLSIKDMKISEIERRLKKINPHITILAIKFYQ